MTKTFELSADVKKKYDIMMDIVDEYTKKILTKQQAKTKMMEKIGVVTNVEFSEIENYINSQSSDGSSSEKMRLMIVLFEDLVQIQHPHLPYDHPIAAYIAENDEARELLKKCDDILANKFIVNPLLEVLEELAEYKIHYKRKQNQLYSALERRDFMSPSTVMWHYDDYVRDQIYKAIEICKTGDEEKFRKHYKEMSLDLIDLMTKEEKVLYPVSCKLITEEEFEEMKHGDREIGFFKISVPEYKPKQVNPEPESSDFLSDLANLLGKYGVATSNDENKEMHVAEGQLTLEQINLIFKHMPVDLSYVDEHEIVKFYTDTEHRVFPRSKGVIGREVVNCHPPKSVHIVEEIISKFRRGEQNRAEFWINKPDCFIYIIYVAVRDQEGNFRGVLEMMQDATHIRSLEGSRTLLTWDEEQKEAKSEPEPEQNECKANADLKITPDTMLKDLIAAYPQLKTDLVKIHSNLKMLNTPMAKIILPKATVKIMGERTDMELSDLIPKLENLIASYKQ